MLNLVTRLPAQVSNDVHPWRGWKPTADLPESDMLTLVTRLPV
jgi:hypothetical protein